MRQLARVISRSAFAETLFDQIPDVVFFVKDPRGRYRVVNRTLVERCGLANKRRLLGRTTTEVFPPPLGDRYLEQDRAVIRTGLPLKSTLELHLYPNRLEGWCLTDKIPLRDDDGAVVGIAGISRDLHSPADDVEISEIARLASRIRADLVDPPGVELLAGELGWSPYQLNRRLKRHLGITVRQLLVKTRIDTASALLRETSLPIGEIAQRSGYFDQSAFTRQFRKSTGLTPRQYRHRHRKGA
jgi:AraC-like DNA-binding protein